MPPVFPPSIPRNDEGEGQEKHEDVFASLVKSKVRHMICERQTSDKVYSDSKYGGLDALKDSINLTS